MIQYIVHRETTQHHIYGYIAFVYTSITYQMMDG